MSEQGSEAYWARVLWQRHNLRIEEFLAMPYKTKIVYIACEMLENENPVRRDTMKGGGL